MLNIRDNNIFFFFLINFQCTCIAGSEAAQIFQLLANIKSKVPKERSLYRHPGVDGIEKKNH